MGFVSCGLLGFRGVLVGTVMVLVFVRIYVNHVKNIYHLELANPLTKCTLLVIW